MVCACMGLQLYCMLWPLVQFQIYFGSNVRHGLDQDICGCFGLNVMHFLRKIFVRI
jgi:hypothetical protein